MDRGGRIHTAKSLPNTPVTAHIQRAPQRLQYDLKSGELLNQASQLRLVATVTTPRHMVTKCTKPTAGGAGPPIGGRINYRTQHRHPTWITQPTLISHSHQHARVCQLQRKRASRLGGERAELQEAVAQDRRAGGTSATTRASRYRVATSGATSGAAVVADQLKRDPAGTSQGRVCAQLPMSPAVAAAHTTALLLPDRDAHARSAQSDQRQAAHAVERHAVAATRSRSANPISSRRLTAGAAATEQERQRSAGAHQ